jgi:hypothetical protein
MGGCDEGVGGTEEQGLQSGLSRAKTSQFGRQSPTGFIPRFASPPARWDLGLEPPSEQTGLWLSRTSSPSHATARSTHGMLCMSLRHLPRLLRCHRLFTTTIPPNSRTPIPHHDAPSFLRYARDTALSPTTTIYVGTLYEYVFFPALNCYSKTTQP